MSQAGLASLDANALSRFASLQLRVQQVLQGVQSGIHRSKHHGAAVEFAQYKEYTPGDDLKRLDWKAYAKFDRYFIRQYENETQLSAYLLIDCSASMGYGEPLTKLEYGSVLVGALAYLLSRQRDRPALIAYADEIKRYLPGRSQTRQAVAMVKQLQTLEAEGVASLGVAAEHVERIAQRKRGLVIVVSDFLSHEDEIRWLGLLRAARHEVMLVHLMHEDELTFPFKRFSRFDAIEQEKHMYLDPVAVRKRYLAACSEFRARLEASCREKEVRYQLVSTATSVEHVLANLLSGISGAAQWVG